VRVRRLWIQNFRGIKELDWKLPTDQRLVALVGPGDSGKSTILDAVHFLLGDRWNVPFADTDFFRGEVEKPISIRALVINVPAAVKKETALGLWMSGVDQGGEIHRDPEDALEPALLVQLAVDASLEPRWSVLRTDGSEQYLTSTQRRSFSTFKVDDRTDVQLRWSRNSALGRMSAKDGGERDALAAASRVAREALADHSNSSLTELAASVQDRANKVGGGSFSYIRPGLDTSRSSMGAGLALYEDVVPLTSYGLGSRRLASLAVQQLAAGSRSVAVVDELESGLEPHRAVRLLDYLLSDDDYSQVLVTTHSPVIVEQARIENLATVQNQAGVVTVTSLGGSKDVLQRLRRARPSSLLARRVIVAEGKTEHGLLLEYIEAWDAVRISQGLPTSAGEGVAIQDGNGGTEVAPRAEALARLGFVVAGFCDNDDRAVDAPLAAAQAAGIVAIRWSFGHNTESQTCAELEADGLQSFLELGVQRRNGEDTVLQDINAADTANPLTSLDVASWLAVHTLADVRARVTKAAVDREWFKDVPGGRELGKWINDHYTDPQLATTVATLEQIRSFVYAEPIAANAARATEAEAAESRTAETAHG
jgi:putative ATP-dependent endonuclease of the OLD family